MSQDREPPCEELPAPPGVAPPRELILPDDPSLARFRAEATTCDALFALRERVAAVAKIAESLRAARHEVMRLASFQLQLERDLGVRLAATVRPGPRRRLSSGVTIDANAGLPAGMSRNQSAAVQRLAGLPQAVFDAYLQQARERCFVPSRAGAMRFPAIAAAPPAPARDDLRLPTRIVIAIRRILQPEVVVGCAALRPGGIPVLDDACLPLLRGAVFVGSCDDPTTWLPRLRRLRNQGQISRVVVALEAAVWADWFRELPEDGWSLCFVRGHRTRRGHGLLLAHLGAQPAGFRVGFHDLGAVVG